MGPENVVQIVTDNGSNYNSAGKKLIRMHYYGRWLDGTREIKHNNIMVYCGGSAVFLKSIDTSDKIKSAEYLIGILSEVIE